MRIRVSRRAKPSSTTAVIKPGNPPKAEYRAIVVRSASDVTVRALIAVGPFSLRRRMAASTRAPRRAGRCRSSSLRDPPVCLLGLEPQYINVITNFVRSDDVEGHPLPAHTISIPVGDSFCTAVSLPFANRRSAASRRRHGTRYGRHARDAPTPTRSGSLPAVSPALPSPIAISATAGSTHRQNWCRRPAARLGGGPGSRPRPR